MWDASGIGSVKMPRLERPHYLLDNLARKRRIFSMPRELTLDGGEITLLKRIGLSGGQIYGRLLVDDLEQEEIPIFLETLIGLLEQNYVLTNKVNVRLSKLESGRSKKPPEAAASAACPTSCGPQR